MADQYLWQGPDQVYERGQFPTVQYGLGQPISPYIQHNALAESRPYHANNTYPVHEGTPGNQQVIPQNPSSRPKPRPVFKVCYSVNQS